MATNENLFIWGNPIVEGLQTLENPILTYIAEGAGVLGEGFIYIDLFHTPTGIKLIALASMGTFLNIGMKIISAAPRPYWVDPIVRPLECRGNTFGFPSGHLLAAFSLFLWLLISQNRIFNRFTRPLVWGLWLLWVIFTTFSRMYLGVHYPADM